MGSPLSRIVAKLYMEAFEKRALDTATQKPILWIRYVDDVFAIWPHGDQALDAFLTHLNSQHPAIQFTMEKEKDQKIAFLDVQVERKGDSTTTSIFRKKTHTNQYINYNSHHHNRTKSGVIQCLATRVEKICHPTRLPQERQHLRAVFHGIAVHAWKTQQGWTGNLPQSSRWRWTTHGGRSLKQSTSRSRKSPPTWTVAAP